MRKSFVALAIVAPLAQLSAQGSPQTASQGAEQTGELPRHVVMITRAGPNFARMVDYRAEARAHHELWDRLAAEGHTIAGGPFEGQPVMGMTIFRAGIDESRVRELMKDDQFPKLGITQVEFRTLVVADGSFQRR